MSSAPAAKDPAQKRRSRQRLFVEVGVVILFIIGLRMWQQRDAADGMAPALSGTTVEGTPLTLDVPADGPTLVHFWATWCGVCEAEEGNVASLPALGYRVVTVASQSGEPAAVERYVEEHGLTFPVVLDQRGELAHQWGVSAFPTSFVLSPDGTIEHVEVGYTTEAGLRTRLWLAGF